MAQAEDDAVSQTRQSIDDMFTESSRSDASSRGSSDVGLSSQSQDIGTAGYFSGDEDDEAEAKHRVTSPAVSMPESSPVNQAGAAAQSGSSSALLSDSHDSGFGQDDEGADGEETRGRARSMMQPVIRLLSKGRRVVHLATRRST